MTGQSENKPIHVSILALPESTPVAIYGLYEVFSSVGVVWPELTGEGEAAPRFDVKIVSLDGKPFTCPIGITIAPNASIADIAETDVVIATDLALPPGFEPGDRWPEMSEWLRARHRDGAIVCSVCTGTVPLGGGRRARRRGRDDALVGMRSVRQVFSGRRASPGAHRRAGRRGAPRNHQRRARRPGKISRSM
jgi:putative intracellular protease/amidase